MQIRKGTETDIEEVSALYDAVNDYLESHTNYPGWRKGVYPTREDAAQGIAENNLFVAEVEGQIAGTFILRHRPEEAYALADWGNQLDYSEILVLYTFAVHPRFLRQGIGKQLMEFILGYAAREKIKAVRLDVYEKNTPAIRLYEQMGFQYVDTVDLGYGCTGWIASGCISGCCKSKNGICGRKMKIWMQMNYGDNFKKKKI